MSEFRINAKTGLKEGWDAHYRLPLVHQKSIGSLRLNGQISAVHTVPLPRGLSLDFFAQLKRSDELIVTLPGAARREKNIYPFFNRVTTFRGKVPAFIAFADPTILMDPARDLRLGWFIGGAGFDPAAHILQVIRRAQGRTGAKHIVFVGGSGGGFAALRLSAMVPGSLAYVHEGATNIAQSLPRSVAQYFGVAWPGWDQAALLDALPERFDMVRHYRTFRPDNHVFFAQSEDDHAYREKHYAPFRNACGVTTEDGSMAGGRRTFRLYKGTLPGHGKVTPAEFQQLFAEALAAWRAARP